MPVPQALRVVRRAAQQGDEIEEAVGGTRLVWHMTSRVILPSSKAFRCRRIDERYFASVCKVSRIALPWASRANRRKRTSPVRDELQQATIRSDGANQQPSETSSALLMVLMPPVSPESKGLYRYYRSSLQRRRFCAVLRGERVGSDMSRSVAQKMGAQAGTRTFFANAPGSALAAIELPSLDMRATLSHRRLTSAWLPCRRATGCWSRPDAFPSSPRASRRWHLRA